MTLSEEGRLVTSRYTGSSRKLLLASVCAYSGAVSFGYVIGYTGTSALSDMKSLSLLNEEQSMWFGSLANIGAMFGCIVAGYCVEKLGRKASLIAAFIPFIFGWFAINIATTTNMLYFGRILTGIGSGIVTVSAPLYISEIATKELRGMLGSGVQLGVTLGILLVYLLGMVLDWRSMALVGVCIPIFGMVMTFCIPETPRFLLLKGKQPQALKALAFLRDPHADVKEECNDILESLDSGTSLSWKEFGQESLLQPLKVALGLFIFQQLSGINIVMFYTVSIFESAGWKEGGDFAAVLIGAAQVIATLGACFMMDKLGRRFLLLVSGIGLATTCMTMSLYYKLSETGSGSTEYSWLALSSLIVYIIAFSFGWGPIPMLVVSEIFPVAARGRASAMATTVNWIAAFLVTKEFHNMQLIFGQSGTFMLFGMCCLIGLSFVWKYVPETKGKSLEDIELYFLGRAQFSK